MMRLETNVGCYLYFNTVTTMLALRVLKLTAVIYPLEAELNVQSHISMQVERH